VRIDDDSLRVTVNNEQYHGTSVSGYDIGIFHQLPTSVRSKQAPSVNFLKFDYGYKPTTSVLTKERSAPRFQETVQYGYPYKEPQPVPPVKEIVQQTGHLLSQVDDWNPISLQPRHDIAPVPAPNQSAVSQPLLVNISNSKYASLDASSSLAQNLLKNINLLGKAFSSSSVTYNPTDSIAAISGSSSTSYFGSGDGVSGSSLPLPVVSSRQGCALTGEHLSLKYSQPESAISGGQPSSTAKSSTCDPVIANVLKSIGFNFDLSKFGSTDVPKEHEQAHASSLKYSPVSTTPPQPVPPPVQGYDPMQSHQNLTALKNFSEIQKVLQKVREHSRSKLSSPSAVMERVRSRSRSRHGSSSVSASDRSVRKSQRSTTEQKKPTNEQWKRSVERSERHFEREELRQWTSPSTRRHDIKAGVTSERKPRLTQLSLLLPHDRRTSSGHESLKSNQKKHKVAERQASPSPRRRDTKAGKASERRPRSTRSSSLSRHSRLMSSGHKRPSPKAPRHGELQRLVSKPSRTTSLQKNREDIEWEKNTEEFLRKLHDTSRPFAAPASHSCKPTVEGDLRDLSSISSGSVADDIDEDDDVVADKSLTSPQKHSCQDTADKLTDTAAELKDKIEDAKPDKSHVDQTKSEDVIASEDSKLRTSVDRPASDASTVKVCGLFVCPVAVARGARRRTHKTHVRRASTKLMDLEVCLSNCLT